LRGTDKASPVLIGETGLIGTRLGGGKNPDRMPLMISREKESAWLNHFLKNPEIQAFFQPIDTNMMDAYLIANFT